MVIAFWNFFDYIAPMFIREVKKKNGKGGKTFFQYQLCQASRIAGKVKQQSILYLGSSQLLEDGENRKSLLKVLKAMIFGQSLLFINDYPADIVQLARNYHEKFQIKYKDVDVGQSVSIPPVESKAQMETVDMDSLEMEDSRTFGGEHLCAQIMEKLDFGTCLEGLGFDQKQVDMAHISIISRALFTASEHKTAQYLRDSSELQKMFGHQQEQISHYSLYKAADQLYENREVIDQFLYKKVTDLFNLKDSLVIYDLSNTYFEGRKPSSQLAQYGRSKEKRNDCKQVVFTGVINPEGFIRYSRIYEGNIADITTLEQMVTDLETHSDQLAGKIVVMDAGFASESNIAYLDKKSLQYVCVSRVRPKDFQPDPNATPYKVTDNRKNPIELQVFHPEGFHDTWLYVKSEQKRVKEESMANKLEQRFEQELTGLSMGLGKKGTVKKTEKVWERIGRIKEKHRGASGRYTIEIAEEKGNVVQLTWVKKDNMNSNTKTYGEYFIRTNIKNTDEEQLWQAYNTIREVEATFRCLKSDLLLRPVHHQKDQRVQAHIYLAILAYQLVNTIRYMLKEKDIHHDWKNIVRIMNTQTIHSVLLNTETKKICVRKPSRPIALALDIYKATATQSMIPATKKYVVYH